MTLDPYQLARLFLEYCDETMETPSMKGWALWMLDQDTSATPYKTHIPEKLLKPGLEQKTVQPYVVYEIPAKTSKSLIGAGLYSDIHNENNSPVWVAIYDKNPGEQS